MHIYRISYIVYVSSTTMCGSLQCKFHDAPGCRKIDVIAVIGAATVLKPVLRTALRLRVSSVFSCGGRPMTMRELLQNAHLCVW